MAKLLFFCVSMSTVGWQRFQNNFYLENGLSTSQVGTLKAIGLLFKFVASPVFCFLSDISNPKYILMQMLGVQILTIWMLKTLPKPIGYYSIFAIKLLRATTAPTDTITTSASFKLTEGTSQGFGQQRMFGSLAWGLGALLCGILIDSYGMTSVFYYTNTFNLITLALVFILPTVYMGGGGGSSSGSSASSFGDGTKDKDNDASSFLDSGTSLTPTPTSNDLGQHQHHEITFPLMYTNTSSSGSSIDEDKSMPSVYSSSSSSNSSNSHNNSNKVLLKPSIRLNSSSLSFALSSQFKAHIYDKYNTIIKFLNYPTSRTLLLNVFINGIVMTVPDTFLYLSLEKDYHASRKFSGFCTTVSIISAMPLFWYSDHLIKQFGHFDLVFYSQLIGAARLIFYFLVHSNRSEYSLNLILTIQLLHGFQFSLFWAASVDLIYKIAPKDLTASCLSTLNVVYFTLAGAVGNLAWGFLYDWTGSPSSLYALSSILCLLNAMHFKSHKALISSEPESLDKNDV